MPSRIDRRGGKKREKMLDVMQKTSYFYDYLIIYLALAPCSPRSFRFLHAAGVWSSVYALLSTYYSPMKERLVRVGLQTNRTRT